VQRISEKQLSEEEQTSDAEVHAPDGGVDNRLGAVAVRRASVGRLLDHMVDLAGGENEGANPVTVGFSGCGCRRRTSSRSNPLQG
jgi:hypothetical protein